MHQRDMIRTLMEAAKTYLHFEPDRSPEMGLDLIEQAVESAEKFLDLPEPLFDDKGYPLPHTLMTIKLWRLKDPADVQAFLSYCKRAWRHETNWDVCSRPDELVIDTVGWKGNDAVLEAMKENQVFWNFCWEASSRNGRHKFSGPMIATQYEIEEELGDAISEHKKLTG